MSWFEFWIPFLSGVEVLLWQHIMVEKKSYALERHTNPNVNLSSATSVLTGWASYLTFLVKWKLYSCRDAMKMKAPKMNSSVVMMMFWCSFRWNKRQRCSGGRAPHCGQSSSSSSILTPGCTRRPCRSTCSGSWWPCSVVGVAVCQILDPPTTLAGKGDRRGHQEAWLQTSSHWVRIWFVPHTGMWSSRYIYLYHILGTLQSIV